MGGVETHRARGGSLDHRGSSRQAPTTEYARHRTSSTRQTQHVDAPQPSTFHQWWGSEASSQRQASQPPSSRPPSQFTSSSTPSQLGSNPSPRWDSQLRMDAHRPASQEPEIPQQPARPLEQREWWGSQLPSTPGGNPGTYEAPQGSLSGLHVDNPYEAPQDSLSGLHAACDTQATGRHGAALGSSDTAGASSTDDKSCVVCMENPRDTVLLECGHIAVCHHCAVKLSSCPICRGAIVRVVKTYAC